MTAIEDDAVDLVVTSPPYPMIEMWDEVFARLNPAIDEALGGVSVADEGTESDGSGAPAGEPVDRDGSVAPDAAFQKMHDVLETVWAEVARVLAPGGIACINVGDATRSFEDGFRSFPNSAEITNRVTNQGLRALPDILWRKPNNSAAKFMGSGMLPPNAYPTLEHEYVLVFRNGGTRSFEPGDDDRYESAYFWEERNEWFSDLWELPGTSQDIEEGLRERSGAFPFILPYRLISMFSVYRDTVLDPFLGTGTTTVAAAAAGRNSVGYEVDAELRAALDARMDSVPERSQRVARDRLEQHRGWIDDRRANGTEPNYDAVHYDVGVTTKQERRIRFRVAEDVSPTEDGYRVVHRPLQDVRNTDRSGATAADEATASGEDRGDAGTD